MVAATFNSAGEAIISGIQQIHAGQKVQVLQVRPGGDKGGVGYFKGERLRQRTADIKARTTRALGERKVIGPPVTGGDQRIRAYREAGGPSVQLTGAFN